MAIEVTIREVVPIPANVKHVEDGKTAWTKQGVTFEVESDNFPLLEWWLGTAIDDFNQGASKVDEYGAHDLELMGAMLLVFGYKEHIDSLMSKIAGPGESPYAQLPLGTEIAVWFYVLGKVSRLLSDYLARRPGKDDTWHDITFYSMMARRIQMNGRWP